MAKRIIVDPDFTCCCGTQSGGGDFFNSGGSGGSGGGEPRRIYTGDDFKLSYKFVDTRYTPKVIIPPKYVNCIFKYVVLGGGDIEYIASCIDGVCTNCVIDEGTKTLKVLFKEHGLPAGKLVVSYKFIIRDPEFPAEEACRHESTDTGIILTDNEFENVYM